MALLLRLWTRPAAAMNDILDRGSLLFASIAVLVVTAALKVGAPWLAADDPGDLPPPGKGYNLFRYISARQSKGLRPQTLCQPDVG